MQAAESKSRGQDEVIVKKLKSIEDKIYQSMSIHSEDSMEMIDAVNEGMQRFGLEKMKVIIKEQYAVLWKRMS
jgi:hypothetical protein